MIARITLSSAVALVGLGLLAAASMAAPASPLSPAPADAPTKPSPLVAQLAGSNNGPVDFRCDSMQVFTKPNRTACMGNVVLRRADLMVCCQRLDSLADEKWQVTKLICTDDVRAQRGDESVWAKRADYAADTSDLVLTGKPLLRRGESLIEGERVTIDMDEEQARIERPRGHLTQQPKGATNESLPKAPGDAAPGTQFPQASPAAAVAAAPAGALRPFPPLPAICPLAKAPKH